MLRVIDSTGAALSADQVEAVWTFSQRFVRRDRAEFVGKLREARRVRLYLQDGRVAGLLALDPLATTHNGRPTLAIHIRWAMLDRSLRRRGLLARQLARIWIATRLRHPLRPIFILFAAATWRSYLAAVSAVPGVWPRPDTPTPDAILGMADGAMRQIAGDDWQAGKLIGRGQWRYQEGLIHEADRPDRPEMRLYAQLNPEQAQGDAPLCVIPTSLGRAIHVVVRSIGQRLRGRRREAVSS